MNTSPEVDAWLAAYDNPQKDLVAAVRLAVLAADDRVTECIKWQAPTFVYKGNIASFFPKAKKHASLMFHRGAHIPGDWSSLEGDAKDGRSMKFKDLADLAKKQAELSGLVKAWCDMKDAE